MNQSFVRKLSSPLFIMVMALAGIMVACPARAQSLLLGTVPEEVTVYSGLDPAAGTPPGAPQDQTEITTTTTTTYNSSGASSAGTGSMPAISVAEAENQFHAMDVNNDGMVTFSEFSAAYPRFFSSGYRAGQPMARFVALDKNSDGQLSEQEFVANRNLSLARDKSGFWVPNGARGADE